jgi:hypothetical protein
MSLTCIPLLAQGLATFIADAAVLGTCTEIVATSVFTLSFLYMCNALVESDFPFLGQISTGCFILMLRMMSCLI